MASDGSTNTKEEVGGLLGMLHNLGQAYGDSVTPQGTVSISALLNLGGARDKLVKYKAGLAEAQQNQLELQRMGILKEQAGVADAFANLPMDEQKTVQGQLVNRAMGPYDPNTPTTEKQQQDVASILGTYGMTDQDLAGRQEKLGKVTTGFMSATGVPKGQQETLRPALEAAGSERLGMGTIQSAQSAAVSRNRLAEIAARKGATASAQLDNPKTFLGVMDKYLPPEVYTTTEMQENPNLTLLRQSDPEAAAEAEASGIFPPVPVSKRVFAPRKAEDIERAATLAGIAIERARDFYRNESGGKAGQISLTEIAATKKAKEKAQGLIKAGVQPDAAVFMSNAEIVGAPKAFKLPRIDEGYDRTAMPALVARYADYFAQMAARNSPAVQGLSRAQFLSQQLAAAGYADQDIAVILQQAGQILNMQQGS